MLCTAGPQPSNFFPIASVGRPSEGNIALDENIIHQNIKCNNLTKTFVDGSLLLSSILRFDFFAPLLDWWMWTECKSGQDVAPLMSVGTDGVREWGRGPQTPTDLVAICRGN